MWRGEVHCACMVLCHTTHLAAVLALSMAPPPGWPVPRSVAAGRGCWALAGLLGVLLWGVRTFVDMGLGCAGVENVQYVSSLTSLLSVWQDVWPELQAPY